MFAGPVLGPVPYETGQPGSAGETQLNLVSDRGRGAVESGGTWSRTEDHPATGKRGTLARWPRSTGRSGSRGRQWNKRKKKKLRRRPGPAAPAKFRHMPKEQPCPVSAAWPRADPHDRSKGKLVAHDGQEPGRSASVSPRLPVLASGTIKADPEPDAAAAPPWGQGLMTQVSLVSGW